MIRIVYVTLALFCGLSFAHADRYEEPLIGHSSYIFGLTDYIEDQSSCRSLSGINLFCDSQRSQVSDPIYLGLGVNIATTKYVRFAIEADVDSGLNSNHKLVPIAETGRGLSLKGSVALDLL